MIFDSEVAKPSWVQQPMLCEQHLAVHCVVSVGGDGGATKRFDRNQVWLLEQA